MTDVIRKAASVIAAREAPDGFEVLVLERAATSRFLPGYVAFPGGSVDGSDVELAILWFSNEDEAARACAVRELVEEVGLVLTASGLEESTDRSLEPVADSPPALDLLPEVAHWIAPPEVPVRFDARYFALRAPGDLGVTPDGAEVADAWWITPRSLLHAWRDGRRKLYWPTYFTVSSIAGCQSVDELLKVRIRTREPDDDEVERLPRSTFWSD